jgi:hypothetical protein
MKVALEASFGMGQGFTYKNQKELRFSAAQKENVEESHLG